MALRQHISSPMTKGSCRYVLMLDNEERGGSGLLVSQYGECTTTGTRQRQRPITRLGLGSSNRRPGVRHSTFESLCLGRSSQSIASGFLRLWDSLNFKKDREFVGITVLFLDEKVNSVIHGFTPVGRANHYMPSLKACSIVKVDHFEVAKCSSMYKITDHSFLIRFISLTIIDEVITGAP
ncbi:hypothetical protein F2Q69_00028935 [Brassica cretica]|uniref:DUF223 domain-containing protein n=1 Tax=Brassica cretica TaxID=69181 RepID=A0A8S9RTN4_BRACR|nr:hypothetical protein F2Q69_00028935 [Brassica cretica]